MFENMNVCSVLGLAGLIVFGFLILKALVSPAHVQTGNRYFKSPIPKGMRIYETTRVVGTSFRLQDVLAWSAAKKQNLKLSGDPKNKHDKNAIMVIGACQTKKGEQHAHLGFVDKDIAARIAKMKVEGELDLVARLKAIWISDDLKQASIEFDLLGPKEHYKEFMGR